MRQSTCAARGFASKVVVAIVPAQVAVVNMQCFGKDVEKQRKVRCYHGRLSLVL